MKIRWLIIFFFMALVSIAGLFIPESSSLYNVVDENINYADTAWMITATVLVLLMTPGVSFFYGDGLFLVSALLLVMILQVLLAIL